MASYTAKRKILSGAFYFDHAEAPKRLPFTGTEGLHALIDSISIRKLHRFFVEMFDILAPLSNSTAPQYLQRGSSAGVGRV